MSTLTTRSRQNEDQLDALLEVDPSVATRSDSYVNNVEKLALNSNLVPTLSKSDFFGGIKTGIEKEGYGDVLQDSREDGNDYLSKLNEEKKLENFDLDKDIYRGEDNDVNNYEPEPLDDPHDLETSYDSLASVETWRVRPSYMPDSADVGVLSYPERNIESELEKGAVEADLDRVEKLADEVYQE